MRFKSRSVVTTTLSEVTYAALGLFPESVEKKVMRKFPSLSRFISRYTQRKIDARKAEVKLDPTDHMEMPRLLGQFMVPLMEKYLKHNEYIPLEDGTYLYVGDVTKRDAVVQNKKQRWDDKVRRMIKALEFYRDSKIYRKPPAEVTEGMRDLVKHLGDL